MHFLSASPGRRAGNRLLTWPSESPPPSSLRLLMSQNGDPTDPAAPISDGKTRRNCREQGPGCMEGGALIRCFVRLGLCNKVAHVRPCIGVGTNQLVADQGVCVGCVRPGGRYWTFSLCIALANTVISTQT